FQFAFDSRKKNPYLPHLYSKNVVAYTGTHDNDTLMGWASSLSEPVLKRALRYTGVDTLDALPLKMLDLIMQSPADLVIIPMQDWLGIGSAGRINTPGSSRGNWVFRMQKKDVSKEGIQTLTVLTKDSNRLT
ncbi:MAG: 4-alpha-glucanotransferase, partial [Anaerovoracaceae bacterium]